jgi:hypothetical protein
MWRTKVSITVQHNGILYSRDFVLEHRPADDLADIVESIVRGQWGSTPIVYSWSF